VPLVPARRLPGDPSRNIGSGRGKFSEGGGSRFRSAGTAGSIAGQPAVIRGCLRVAVRKGLGLLVLFLFLLGGLLFLHGLGRLLLLALLRVHTLAHAVLRGVVGWLWRTGKS